MIDNDTLDYLARRLGLLYDESLRTDRDCMKVSCSIRKEDGTCTCTDKIRDVIDIWCGRLRPAVRSALTSS